MKLSFRVSVAINYLNTTGILTGHEVTPTAEYYHRDSNTQKVLYPILTSANLAAVATDPDITISLIYYSHSNRMIKQKWAFSCENSKMC